MRDLNGKIVIDTEAIERMLARKRRALARKTAESFDITHPHDAVIKAVAVANIQGAIDVLEELLHNEGDANAR